MKILLHTAAIGLMALLVAPAVLAEDWEIEISGSDALLEIDGEVPTESPVVLTDLTQNVTVQCPDEATCATVQLAIGDDDEERPLTPSGSGTQRQFQFTLADVPAEGGEWLLTFGEEGDQRILAVEIAQGASKDLADRPAGLPGATLEGITSEGDTVADLLKTLCTEYPEAGGYNRSANRASVVVTPTGLVLSESADIHLFDENDTLEVTVVADVRLLPLLTVRRTSAFRDARTIRLIGEGADLTGLDLQSAEDLDLRIQKVCGSFQYRLSNFAPGRGVVEIKASGLTDAVGEFDLQVNPLYSGMLTLGPIQTDLVDRMFTLSAVGSDQIVTAGSQGDDEVLYAIFYTPFLWGKRDLEKKYNWYEHINLSIGAAFEDVADNAFVGISVDLPRGFVVTWGKHFGQVSVLPEELDLSPGDTFDAPMDADPMADPQLPTATSWEDDEFIGFTVDLRAAVTFFKAALGGGSSGGG